LIDPLQCACRPMNTLPACTRNGARVVGVGLLREVTVLSPHVPRPLLQTTSTEGPGFCPQPACRCSLPRTPPARTAADRSRAHYVWFMHLATSDGGGLASRLTLGKGTGAAEANPIRHPPSNRCQRANSDFQLPLRKGGTSRHATAVSAAASRSDNDHNGHHDRRDVCIFC
jgi:hypothetical protein